MKLLVSIYILFSLLISTTFSNLLIAKIVETSNIHEICTYNGVKILLSNGKLIDKAKFYENCEICVGCSTDSTLDTLSLNFLKGKYALKNNFYYKKILFTKYYKTKTIRDPPLN